VDDAAAFPKAESTDTAVTAAVTPAGLHLANGLFVYDVLKEEKIFLLVKTLLVHVNLT
jgi:hypothetical protein